MHFRYLELKCRYPEVYVGQYGADGEVDFVAVQDEDGCFDPDLWQDQCHRFLIVLQKINKKRALDEAAGDSLQTSKKQEGASSSRDDEDS